MHHTVLERSSLLRKRRCDQGCLASAHFKQSHRFRSDVASKCRINFLENEIECLIRENPGTLFDAFGCGVCGQMPRGRIHCNDLRAANRIRFTMQRLGDNLGRQPSLGERPGGVERTGQIISDDQNARRRRKRQLRQPPPSAMRRA